MLAAGRRSLSAPVLVIVSCREEDAAAPQLARRHHARSATSRPPASWCSVLSYSAILQQGARCSYAMSVCRRALLLPVRVSCPSYARRIGGLWCSMSALCICASGLRSVCAPAVPGLLPAQLRLAGCDERDGLPSSSAPDRRPPAAAPWPLLW